MSGDRRSVANTIITPSARSGDGTPRLRISSFDSIRTRPLESSFHLIAPSRPASRSSNGSMSISVALHEVAEIPVRLGAGIDEPLLVHRGLAVSYRHVGSRVSSLRGPN